MYGFTLRGPASRLAEPPDSPSASSSLGALRVGSTKGRESNLIGGDFSLAGWCSACACAAGTTGAFTRAGWAT